MGSPLFSLVIMAASLASSLIPELASVFIFQREAIFHGEIWRLLTCHFVHLSHTHLAYNLLAFGIAGYIIEKKQYPNFFSLYLCSAAGISIFLIFSEPGMAFYGGLSGIACGALYYCALMGLKDPMPWQRICLLVVFFLPLKIAVEIFTNGSVLPYPEAHAFVPMQASHVMGCTVAVMFSLFGIKGKSYSGKALSLTPETAACRLRGPFQGGAR
jgi:rhomboid family GlyGly-CTERM serine protease